MRVVVADDQTAVREGLVMILERMDGVEVVGAAADGAEAVELAAALAPDVVLMDLHMPRTDGVAATAAIRAMGGATQVVVLTTYADDTSVLAALRAGALSYLTKDAGRDDIRRALDAAVAGQAVLDPVARQHLVAATGAPRRSIDGPLPDGLTRREAEVLGLVADGRSNTEIASDLYLSEATVKTHINRIFAKTSSRDRPQAIAYAHRVGLAG